MMRWLFTGVRLLLLLLVFSAPKPYYMGILVVPIAAIVITTIVAVVPGRQRSARIAAVILTCASIWFYQLPLRIRFAFSRPAMNRLLQEAQQHPDVSGAHRQRAGLFEVGAVERWPEADRWTFYDPDDRETGFTYMRTKTSYAGMNSGMDGSLGNGWYWFSDD